MYKHKQKNHRKSQIQPLKNNCLTKNITYKATVTTKDKKKAIRKK